MSPAAEGRLPVLTAMGKGHGCRQLEFLSNRLHRLHSPWKLGASGQDGVSAQLACLGHVPPSEMK